jgi:choline dehydrogenase-like flavoprotein
MWVHVEQRPDSGSRITLSKKQDFFGLYNAAINWKIDEIELYTIRKFSEAACAALAAKGYPEIALNPLLSNDEEVRRVALESKHHIGGVRIASDPRWGVVDENLQIMGVRNCYVCSSAVFPSAGFSNPTHTILALALRLSDFIDSSVD